MDASGGGHQFLEADEYGAWNALLELTEGPLRALDAALQESAGLSVTEFDVLITLFNAPDRRLGMTALARSVLLSPSGLTHLVTRLERNGLLRRIVDPADGRKFYAVLTAEGEERLRQTRPVHNEVLRTSLLQHLSATERRMLPRILARVRAAQLGRAVRPTR